MPTHLKEKSRMQDWPGLKVIGDIKEGEVYLLLRHLKKKLLICNYGGKFMNVKFTLELLHVITFLSYMKAIEVTTPIST